MLKNMEEESKQKDERISHLRDCLTIAVSENNTCNARSNISIEIYKIAIFYVLLYGLFLKHIG